MRRFIFHPHPIKSVASGFRGVLFAAILATEIAVRASDVSPVNFGLPDSWGKTPSFLAGNPA